MSDRALVAGPIAPGNRYLAVKLRGDALDQGILDAAKANGKPFYALDTNGRTIFYNTIDGGKTFTWTDNVQRKDAEYVQKWLSPADAYSAPGESKGIPRLTRSEAFSPDRYQPAPKNLMKQNALPRFQIERIAADARVATGPGGDLYRNAARLTTTRQALRAPWWKKVASVGTSLRQYLHG